MDPTSYYMGICNDGTVIERKDFDGDVLNVFPIRKDPLKDFTVNKENIPIVTSKKGGRKLWN